MNPELKKIIRQLKTVQKQMQNVLQDRTWIEEARKYAERQSREVKKLLAGDVAKVKSFVEKERKELDRFQKQIPAEIDKIRNYIGSQRKELEKLLKKVSKASAGKGKKKSTKRASSARKKATKKTGA